MQIGLHNAIWGETFQSVVPVISTVGRIVTVMHNDYEVLRTNIVRALVGRSFIMFDMDTPYFPIHNLWKEWSTFVDIWCHSRRISGSNSRYYLIWMRGYVKADSARARVTTRGWRKPRWTWKGWRWSEKKREGEREGKEKVNEEKWSSMAMAYQRSALYWFDRNGFSLFHKIIPELMSCGTSSDKIRFSRIVFYSYGLLLVIYYCVDTLCAKNC